MKYYLTVGACGRFLFVIQIAASGAPALASNLVSRSMPAVSTLADSGGGGEAAGGAAVATPAAASPSGPFEETWRLSNQ